MKLMKIAVFAIAATLVMSISAFASVPTGANIPSPTDYTGKPIIKAKWETVPSATSGLDDNPTKDYTQVNPNIGFKAEKEIKFWIIATDPNGFGDLTDYAYAEVYHPDGSPKYQVELKEAYNNCPDDWAQIDDAMAQLTEAYNEGLVTFGINPNAIGGEDIPYTLQEVLDELDQCSAKLFVGTAKINNCQMCGEFEWDIGCEQCQETDKVIDFTSGYKVDAYVFDKYNLQSDILTNYFEFMCVSGIETDFSRLNFGDVNVYADKVDSSEFNKWIEGDRTWNVGTGPACAAGTDTDCRAPSIRNTGNTDVKISVEFDDMAFGTSTAGWNVRWDARLGYGYVSYFDPYYPVTLPAGPQQEENGILEQCTMDKISFSIHVYKAIKTGGHTGIVMIEPTSVTTTTVQG